MNNGIVSTDRKLTTAIVCEAAAVSFPYLVANITVLFAVGAEAEIRSAVQSTGGTPKSFKPPSMTAGNTINFKNATKYVSFRKNIFRKSVLERYVPNISIASGVLRLAM